VKISAFSINLGFISVTFKGEEVNETLTALIQEMQSITSGLQEPEQDILRRIMANPSGKLKVNDLFPGFSRGSKDHDTLRKLREAQFIRPVGSGRWRAESTVEIKQFGKMMWDKIGENQLFKKQK
jgi:hypothetical protein